MGNPNSNKSFCVKKKLFSQYAIQDVKRNKCHFCLAFCSVWLVVWAVFVVNSVTAMGPLAFLSLGQNQQGQIDMIVSPPGNAGIYSRDDYVDFREPGEFLNYTQVREVTEDNYAPRKLLYHTRLFVDDTNYFNSHLTILDTQREAEIDLGTTWPFPPLKAGECLITGQMAS